MTAQAQPAVEEPEPPAQPESAAPEPEPEPMQAELPSEPEQDPWQSAADEGWMAAKALLETKDEEMTPAGLPKRVPNAYLVPGSVSSGERDSFVDSTAGRPGQSAIARSATSARDRMASFQRGYRSGRHALHEGAREHGVSVNGGEPSPTETTVRSDE